MIIRSTTAVALGAIVLATPVTAEPTESGVEAELVQYIVNTDPVLARAIKDAPSQEAFVEAFKKGIERCPVNVEQLSMGRFFTALNKAVPDRDSESEGAE